jgi:hypothetical protein
MPKKKTPSLSLQSKCWQYRNKAISDSDKQMLTTNKDAISDFTDRIRGRQYRTGRDAISEFEQKILIFQFPENLRVVSHPMIGTDFKSTQFTVCNEVKVRYLTVILPFYCSNSPTIPQISKLKCGRCLTCSMRPRGMLRKPGLVVTYSR